MSGICGIINFDGAPVDPELLRKMAEAAAYRGPDGIHYWIEGNVGLAHLAMNTTPESVREHQPLVNQRGDLVLVADARVDNREELESKLRANGYLHTDHPTDADYILAAYECWEENCPKHLVGDFAFAIWDKSKRQLFAARDQMGVRLFHYRHDANTFQWATEAIQLLTDLAYPIKYNEVSVAQDLVKLGGGGRCDGYYEGIEKLEPACCIKFSSKQFSTSIYWDFDPDYEIRYQNENDYVENFMVLFRQAVRARLRSISPVGIFMSGGIDSTSIAAVAADEMKLDSEGISNRLEAVNWMVGSRTEYSETERSRAVAEKWGFGYHEVDVEGRWPLMDFPNFVPYPDEPFMIYVYSFYRASLGAFLNNERPYVWLNGYSGDMAIGGVNLFYYWKLLRNFQVKLLVKKINYHQKLYNLSNSVMKDWVLVPLVIKPLRCYKRWILGRYEIPAWLDEGLIERTGTRDWKIKQDASELTIDLSREARKWKDPQKNLHFRRLKTNRDLRLREWKNRFFATHFADSTGPWDDIRVTQYLLSIPTEVLAQGIHHKLLLRRSLKGILPETICDRFAPRSGTPLYLENCSLEPEVVKKARSIIGSSKAVRLGWVSKKYTDELLSNPGLIQRDWSSLWPYLLLEMWLQTSGLQP